MTTGTATLQSQVDSLINQFGKPAVQTAVSNSTVTATPIAQPAPKLPEYHGINLGDINDPDLTNSAAQTAMIAIQANGYRGWSPTSYAPMPSSLFALLRAVIASDLFDPVNAAVKVGLAKNVFVLQSVKSKPNSDQWKAFCNSIPPASDVGPLLLTFNEVDIASNTVAELSGYINLLRPIATAKGHKIHLSISNGTNGRNMLSRIKTSLMQLDSMCHHSYRETAALSFADHQLMRSWMNGLGPNYAGVLLDMIIDELGLHAFPIATLNESQYQTWISEMGKLVRLCIGAGYSYLIFLLRRKFVTLNGGPGGVLSDGSPTPTVANPIPELAKDQQTPMVAAVQAAMA